MTLIKGHLRLQFQNYKLWENQQIKNSEIKINMIKQKSYSRHNPNLILKNLIFLKFWEEGLLVKFTLSDLKTHLTKIAML
jgi:hypothetical protein